LKNEKSGARNIPYSRQFVVFESLNFFFNIISHETINGDAGKKVMNIGYLFSTCWLMSHKKFFFPIITHVTVNNNVRKK
jgi:hypothetical protein